MNKLFPAIAAFVVVGCGATIAQKPFTMSHYGVLMLDSLHHYKLPSLDIKWAEDTRSPVPMFVDTGDTLIDKRNVAEFLKAQTALHLPSEQETIHGTTSIRRPRRLLSDSVHPAAQARCAG